MMYSKKTVAALCGSALVLALGTGMLAGCGAQSTSSAGGTSADQSSTSASTSSTTGDASVPAVASKDDIDRYCGVCHFQNVGNDPISGFNRDNIDAAMVQSMDATLSSAQVDSIVAYFAQIEPRQQQQN